MGYNWASNIWKSSKSGNYQEPESWWRTILSLYDWHGRGCWWNNWMCMVCSALGWIFKRQKKFCVKWWYGFSRGPRLKWFKLCNSSSFEHLTKKFKHYVLLTELSTFFQHFSNSLILLWKMFSKIISKLWQNTNIILTFISSVLFLLHLGEGCANFRNLHMSLKMIKFMLFWVKVVDESTAIDVGRCAACIKFASYLCLGSYS